MAYSYEELENMGFYEVPSIKEDDRGVFMYNLEKLSSIIPDIDIYSSEEDIRQYIKDLASSIAENSGTHEYIKESIFRRDSRLKNSIECYVEIVEFPTKKTNAGWRFATSTKKSENEFQQEKKKRTKNTNIEVLRLYTMGDRDIPIQCSISKICLENVLPSFQNAKEEERRHCWEQHHYRVADKSSANKDGGKDPNVYLNSVDFTKPSINSVTAIMDLTNTMFLCATEHSKIHKSRVNSDIRDYAPENLPHAVRNEKNWEEFKQKLHDYYGYDRNFLPTFDEQYRKNCNPDS